MFRNTGRHVEDDCTESRHDAYQCRQPQKSNLRPKTVLAQLHNLGNPTENSVHGHKSRGGWGHDVQSFSFRELPDFRRGQTSSIGLSG